VGNLFRLAEALHEDRARTSSPASSRTACDISVSMTPGATALTAILRGASSTASARVNALIAPLLAA
jgi:hypothetical protein